MLILSTQSCPHYYYAVSHVQRAKMRPIVADVAWPVCLSVGHKHELLWSG